MSTILTYVSKIDKTLGKNFGKCEKNNANWSNFDKNINLDNSL